MDRWKIAGIVVRISGTLIVIILLIYLYAVIRQTEEGSFIVQPGTLMNVGDDKDERGISVGNVRVGSAEEEDDLTAVCEMIQAMDFTVEQPHMELSEEEDRAYKEAFLRFLKNELPIKGWNEGEDCYQNLWWAGIPYEELLEERDSRTGFYSYYYDDIDGDGKPEFGVHQQAVYFFDYELGEDACSISYCGLGIYLEGLLGVGKMWEHDVQHAWVERFRYIVLNSDREWETALELERGYAEPNYYDINGVDVGKEKWEELTAPFYEATEHEIPKKTLVDVFGELLEAD